MNKITDNDTSLIIDADKQVDAFIDTIIDYHHSMYVSAKAGILGNNVTRGTVDSIQVIDSSKRTLAYGVLKDAFKTSCINDLQKLFGQGHDFNDRQVKIILDAIQWVNDNF